MDRRRFLTVAGTIGVGSLAGCTVFGSEEVDDTIEMEVENKWLKFEHKPASNPDTYSTGWIIDIHSDEAVLHEDIIEETDLTEDDVGPDTKLGELPMPEIFAAFQRIEYGSITRTYVSVQGELQFQDEINGIDPDEDNPHRGYMATNAFYDAIDPGETHRFRVARSGEYYPGHQSGRIINILK